MFFSAGGFGKLLDHEVDITSSPVPLSPMSPSTPITPSTPVDSDPIAQRLAVLQKRLDIEMKVCALHRYYFTLLCSDANRRSIQLFDIGSAFRSW